MTIGIVGTLKAAGIVIALALLATGGVVVFRPLLTERGRLERVRDEYRRDNDAMSAQITDLKQKQAMFASDPDFVEQMGRRDNRVRPNEIVFVFPQAKTDQR